MKRSIDDPRLTAYALGEVDGDELREIEAWLAEEETARQAVEDTQSLAALLEAELAVEPGRGLTEAQRKIVLAGGVAAASETAAQTGWSSRRWAPAAAVLALAAGVVLAVGLARQTGPDEAPATMAQAPAESAKAEAEPPRSQAAASMRLIRDEVEAEAAPSEVQAVAAMVPMGELERNEHPREHREEGGNRLRPKLSMVDLGDRSAQVDRLKPQGTVKPSVVTGRGLGTGSITGGTVATDAPRVTVDASARPANRQAHPVAGEGILAQLSKNTGSSAGHSGPRDPRGAETASPDYYKGRYANPPPPAPARPLLAARRTDSDSLEAPRAGADPSKDSRTESYAPIVETGFRSTARQPLSTFSVDVDTASFTNVRRFLDSGRLPPPDAVRIEELLAWFPWSDAPPTSGGPFAIRAETSVCPWNGAHRLVRVAIKGREVPAAARPPSNLVFLIDVSGSMKSHDKLPLLVRGMEMLVSQLDPQDMVSIVTYAGGADVVLPPTPGHLKEVIGGALRRLRAKGSTNGSKGLRLAYAVARQGMRPGGTNRVILATDGDFNAGVTRKQGLEQLVAEGAAAGVFLTILGVGTGDLKDDRMEALSARGNGHYAYLDSLAEAHRVLVSQLSGTLVTIAKDVKLQVELNPATVASWRLIGFENRQLPQHAFDDDRRDAGDIGAGHLVTALYEVVPQPAGTGLMRYGVAVPSPRDVPRELMNVRVRYKAPEGVSSSLVELPVLDRGLALHETSPEFRLAAAVAVFGMLLRRSPWSNRATWGLAVELAEPGAHGNMEPQRAEFVRLVRSAFHTASRLP